jgi:non-specific serine/threonine protein kinase/serine/threonine-protein kinase
MAFSEIHRIIREEDPHKPSTRVSTLGEQAKTTARSRGTDARALRKALSGDLDWIVMKTLEKDRTRRYDTANALAQDILRHLRNEPVTAGPPGAAYRTRKFLRRNRTAVSVGAAVAGALLVGLGLATYGFWEASREREAARRAADSAEATSAFFADMLASVNPDQLHLHSAYRVANLAPDAGARFSHDVSVAEMLQSTGGRVAGSFEGQPELQATMHEIIGTTLLGLGESEDAIERFRGAHDLRLDLHGPDHIDVLRTRVIIAEALYNAYRWVEAEEVTVDVLADLERLRGPDDPVTLYAGYLRAILLREQSEHDAADSVFASVLERQERILGPNHRDTILTLSHSAHTFTWRGRGAEALERAGAARERAIANYSPDDAVVLYNESVLGLSHAFLGQYDEAKAVLLPSMEKHRRVYGEDHPRTRNLAFSLARAHGRPDELERRVAYYLHALRGSDSTEILPIEPVAWLAARDVAGPLVTLGREREAIEILRAQFDFWNDTDREELGFVWPDWAVSIRRNLRWAYSRVLASAGREDEQRGLAQESIRDLLAAAEGTEQDDASAEALNAYAWTAVTVLPPDVREPEGALRFARKAAARQGESPAA